MVAFQISVPAVGYVRWTGDISVPAPNSMKCTCVASEQNLFAPVSVERARVEMFNDHQPRARGEVLRPGYSDGHCARLL